MEWLIVRCDLFCSWNVGIINALCLAGENYRNSNRPRWGRRPPLLRGSPTPYAPCIECDRLG